MQYVYPAIFRKDKKLADTYAVEFPDVSGAVTCGYSLYEALELAEDALSIILCKAEDKRAGRLTESFTNRVDEPTPINQVKVEPDEYSTEAFVTLIKADTDEYRRKLEAQNAARG